MPRRNRQELLRLKDANSYSLIDRKVNIIGVVRDIGLPKKSKGTDMCCSLRLIDETQNTYGMTVNIFTQNAEHLPRVDVAGDIILFRNVALRQYENEVNAVFDKRYSYFAIYKGKDADDDFDTYQTYSNHLLRDEDKVRIVELRRWVAIFQPNEDSSLFPMLREIKEGSFNLACKILHCWEVEEDKWFVFVWDGTDTPPNAISRILEDEINSPLPLHMEPFSLPRDILCSFPTVGSILRIKFDSPVKRNYFHGFHSGKWVKLLKMQLKVDAGLWYGVFTSQSKLRYTPSEDRLILERQRLSDERISLKSSTSCIPQSFGSLSNSLSMPMVNHDDDHVLHGTLMDVLTHPKVTDKFKCVVRVVAVGPYQAGKFFSPDGKYMMRLTLEDPTTRIHAFVADKDGETLFNGFPGITVVKKKLNRLLGVIESDDNVVASDTPINPPWVSVCIVSYYTSSNDKYGSRCFKIFDTKIVGDT